jgi:integrase
VEIWERTHLANLAPKTRERYDSVIRTYVLPSFGATPLGRLNRADFKEWFASLAAERRPSGAPRYAPGTLRKVQVVLSSILSEGVELGLIRENPAARLRLPAAPPTEMTILNAEEIDLLAGAMVRPSDRLAIYLASYGGMRAGELWASQRRDIDLLHRRVYIRRALKDIRGHLEFGDTKSVGSRRTVSLPAFLISMLSEHLDSMPVSPDALLFVSPGGGGRRRAGDGGPTRHSLFVRRVFKPAARAVLPIEKHSVRFHDLRHTCASLLIAAGAHPKLIQARLGHASITTTLDRYGHLFPSVEEALADALDATFNAARTAGRCTSWSLEMLRSAINPGAGYTRGSSSCASAQRRTRFTWVLVVRAFATALAPATATTLPTRPRRNGRSDLSARAESGRRAPAQVPTREAR